MCESSGVRFGGGLRWRGLSTLGLFALAAAAGISVAVPPSPVRTGALLVVIAAAGWGALRWLAAHRAELDRADWCACAPATVGIRVIAARATPSPAGRPVQAPGCPPQVPPGVVAGAGACQPHEVSP